jgi:import inner membrane translocase subunit TIM22
MEFSNYSSAVVTASDGTQRAVHDLPFRQQMREAMRDMGKRSYSMAKSFAVVGGVFATSECIIEGVRGSIFLFSFIAVCAW